VRERLRYWFDRSMSRGAPALIGWLALASLTLIGTVGGLAVLLAPDDVNHDPLHALWLSLLRTLDTGTMGGDQGSPVFLGLMLVVTLGGLFIVSALIGVLTTGLDARLTELRKGRSRVVESGHAVVLGWSDQIVTILGELARADQGQRSCAVILADRDKVEMEDEIRRRVGRTGRVRVVCRTGKPTEPADLEIVRPDRAAVIVVPPPAGEDPDIGLIKTLLALHNRRWPQGRPPVVAVVSDSTNMAAATIAGGEAVELVDAEDITARLVVQSRRHPGLSAVYTDLLSFDGEEIYIRAEPDLTGVAYRSALLAYGSAALIGIRHADGTVALNPPGATTIRADDELVLLAKNDDGIRRAGEPAVVVESAVSTVPSRRAEPEHTLILGWNDRGPTIVRLLDGYLPEGSTVTVAAPDVGAGGIAGLGGLRSLAVTATPCDPTDRRDLEALRPGRFGHVVVLAEPPVPGHTPDSHTLVTLLHLRDMKERSGDRYAIVSELHDDANRRLAQVTRADDFVVGKKLISLLLTQLAKNQHLSQVFAELFDPRGADIYLNPAEEYLRPGSTATFATIVEAAARRGQTAIGYRLQAHVYEPPGYGVVLNPDKNQPLSLQPADRVIVLSEH
jgi:ion channel POLLUX/CASTOR